MQFIFSLLSSYPYFDLPYDLIGWCGLLLLLLLLSLGIYWLKGTLKSLSSWQLVLFLLLSVFCLISSLFIGFRFLTQSSLELLGIPIIYHPNAVMVFSALPMVLVAGFFGPIYAAVMGAINGLLFGLWDTHSFFTLIEYAGLSLLFGWAIRQRYRTNFFRYLRHPIVSAFLLPVFYIPVIILSSFFSSSGDLAIRLNYALTQTWPSIISIWLEISTAGIIGEIIYLSKIKKWGVESPLIPSPEEKSLSMRFMLSMFPLLLASFMFLLVSDWVAAGRASRKLMEDRLANVAFIATESLPYFLETGQNLISKFASEDLFSDSRLPEAELSYKLQSIPFFTDLSLYDSQGIPLISFPETGDMTVSLEEAEGIALALDGVDLQTYSLAPGFEGGSARLAFIARIKDGSGRSIGILIGHADLNTNPFTQPAIRAIESVEELGGEGWILDDAHRVLYHSDPKKVMNKYFGSFLESSGFYEQMLPGEVPKYIYYQSVEGRPWMVVFSVPSSQIHQLSLDIAIPLLIILVIISTSVFLLWQIIMNRVTRSLHLLAEEATHIAQGQLDRSLNIQANDELGRFAEAFEKMRLGLQARLNDLNSLLTVSQNVASHLDAEQAITPILQECLRGDVISARAVLKDIYSLDITNETFSFGEGKQTEQFAFLDQKILELVSQHDIVTIPNCAHSHLLSGYADLPGSIGAYALKHENKIYGVLWIAYLAPRRFSQDETKFDDTLAGQASIAALNASLYATAEVGRQRLEAVLASTPEPVLVMDHSMRLLLLNPAARGIPDLVKSDMPGTPVGDVISHKILLDFIQQPIQEGAATREIIMPTGSIYSASVAEVIASGQSVGKICLLRDISHYKELDALKSDFVSTVSHDLRAPLTLLRGYTTMLEMVGEMNPQQKSYSQKIMTTVENMTHLVNNILDLGRIESGIGLNISKVNVVEIIEKIISVVEPRAMQKSIQLIINEDIESFVTIEADPALLQQAMLNLLENAIKYTPMNGQIEIKTQYGEQAVIFEIKDNGIGISRLDLPHMFEKFYRSGQREAYKQKGTGLGLAIVKSIAERHGGKVWVQSQLGKGSSFFMEIPFHR